MNQNQANEFAAKWIEAWNAHDLDRILSHYTDDFEMNSPLIAKRLAVPSGTLKGKAAVGEYWQGALRAYPDLRFELLKVLQCSHDRKRHTKSRSNAHLNISLFAL